MSEPKLYRHNKSGEVVAAYKNGANDFIIFSSKNSMPFACFKNIFSSTYTALPEAPEVGSTTWAIMMMYAGYRVKRKHWTSGFYELKNNQIVNSQGKKEQLQNYFFHNSFTDYEIYEDPKLIIEKLPHEFMKDEKVLVRSLEGWSLGYFKEFNIVYNKYAIDTKSSFGVCCEYRCLPYEGNEHLEGTFIGEHEYGAVPKGYVPPHTPKLGDETYWAVGDTVYDLLLHKYSNIEEITVGADGKPCGIVSCPIKAFEGRNYALDGQGSHSQRSLFHAKAIILDKHGRILSIDYDYAPTRPHKILEGE